MFILMCNMPLILVDLLKVHVLLHKKVVGVFGRCSSIIPPKITKWFDYLFWPLIPVNFLVWDSASKADV
jgi:hypothetical protein